MYVYMYAYHFYLESNPELNHRGPPELFHVTLIVVTISSFLETIS